MTLTKANILVVDDDAHLLSLLVDTLTSIGYRATGAPGGIEAIEKLNSGLFDLMITDIKMPGIDGITLLKKVRRHFPKLPVLFITGVASDDIIGRASPDGFLAKPFRISHIEELIENTLADKSEKVTRSICKVMVVDDDNTFREMLSEALRYNEYSPFSVAGSELALEELKNGEVDAVITDIKMPGMDGIALMKKIKELYPDLPVILITAFYNQKYSENKNEIDQADGFLEKPFKVETIIDLLSQLTLNSTSQK